MPIEFRCMHCGTLLRTDDDTAGKQAKCPQCGAVMSVPAMGGAPASPFAADPGNPYQSPSAFAPHPGNAPPGEIVATTIDFGDIFRCTWEIFKPNWGTCLLAYFAVLAVNFLISYGLVFGLMMVGRVMVGPRGGAPFSIVGNVIAQLISIWLGIGLMIYMLKVARGEVAEFVDLFSGGPYYVQIFLALLLFSLIFYVGLILCIVPGIILGLMFSQFYYLVLDRGLPVSDAFRTSRELTRGNKLTLFLILLVFGLASVALVLLTCGLGILVVGPYGSLLIPVIYLAITGQRTADQVAAEPAI